MKPWPDNPFLQGYYEPITFEANAPDLVIEGEIPKDLNGTFYRNGPNPQVPPKNDYHFFTGDGMIHAFTFDNVLTTRVNLREQVVWTHEPNDEDTDMMAQDYLRMGIVRAQKASLPEPLQEEVDRTVLVVGGGITGITAALDAAKAGHDVVLVEKSDELGGWMRKWARGIPHAPPYLDPQPIGRPDVPDKKRVETTYGSRNADKEQRSLSVSFNNDARQEIFQRIAVCL